MANRKIRRMLGIKEKMPTYNLSEDQINQLKKRAVDEAVEASVIKMLAVSTMVVHDKFGQLTKKEVDGVTREQRFADFCIDLFDSINREYVTLDELEQWLLDEAGVRIERKPDESV